MMKVLSHLASSFYRKFLRSHVEETVRKSLASYPAEQLFFDATKFVVYNHIPGDYMEFGVFEGESFAKVFGHFHKAWKEYKYYEQLAGHEVDNDFLAQKRFIAFDSFEGLP